MKTRLMKLACLVAVASITVFSGCKKDNNLAGHEYVDLGLESGTLWATTNLGANTPEEFGDYYAWGEITPKDSYTADNYTGNNNNLVRIFSNPIHDAATANWGDDWRMPTMFDIEELASDCTWIMTTQAGVLGYKVVGPNGNSIFLPASGYYDGVTKEGVGTDVNCWTGNASTDPFDGNAISITISTNLPVAYAKTWENCYRGLTIRPVTD